MLLFYKTLILKVLTPFSVCVKLLIIIHGILYIIRWKIASLAYLHASKILQIIESCLICEIFPSEATSRHSLLIDSVGSKWKGNSLVNIFCMGSSLSLRSMVKTGGKKSLKISYQIKAIKFSSILQIMNWTGQHFSFTAQNSQNDH